VSDLAFLERYLLSMWELAHGGLDALREVETDDVHGAFPWGTAAEFRGIEAHAELMATLPQHFADFSAHVTRLQALPEPGTYVAEGGSQGTLRDGSGRLFNGWVTFLTVRDGKVAAFREYAVTKRRPLAPG
jgi:ketosteroid isomerase-like protein